MLLHGCETLTLCSSRGHIFRLLFRLYCRVWWIDALTTTKCAALFDVADIARKDIIANRPPTVWTCIENFCTALSGSRVVCNPRDWMEERAWGSSKDLKQTNRGATRMPITCRAVPTARLKLWRSRGSVVCFPWVKSVGEFIGYYWNHQIWQIRTGHTRNKTTKQNCASFAYIFCHPFFSTLTTSTSNLSRCTTFYFPYT